MHHTVEDVIKDWPKEPQASAQRLLEYYGQPDEYSESTLTWYNTKDAWKRTVLSKEQALHNFPAPHTDFLEQFIDYKVPIEMYSPLAAYDGSVIIERTKGELSARCGGTSMNFVAINLAHDIVTGKRSVEEARAEYTNCIAPTRTAKNRRIRSNSNFRFRKKTRAIPTSRRWDNEPGRKLAERAVR